MLKQARLAGRRYSIAGVMGLFAPAIPGEADHGSCTRRRLRQLRPPEARWKGSRHHTGIQVDVAMRPCDHRQGSRADFQSGGASFSLTLSEEVPAATIRGHVTTYRYQPEGLPGHGARPFGRLAGSRVGIFRPETFGPSHALRGD